MKVVSFAEHKESRAVFKLFVRRLHRTQGSV